MKEEEIKKKKNDFENQAKKRIKTGLILNEFGEQNKIEVSDQELQTGSILIDIGFEKTSLALFKNLVIKPNFESILAPPSIKIRGAFGFFIKLSKKLSSLLEGVYSKPLFLIDP